MNALRYHFKLLWRELADKQRIRQKLVGIVCPQFRSQLCLCIKKWKCTLKTFTFSGVDYSKQRYAKLLAIRCVFAGHRSKRIPGKRTQPPCPPEQATCYSGHRWVGIF